MLTITHLQSLDIPTAMHFWNRQNWHRLRLRRITWHLPSLRQRYSICFCMLRRKNPWKERHESILRTYELHTMSLYNGFVLVMQQFGNLRVCSVYFFSIRNRSYRLTVFGLKNRGKKTVFAQNTFTKQKTKANFFFMNRLFGSKIRRFSFWF